MSGDTDNQNTSEEINALIEIPYDVRKFEANGRTYYVEDNLSIERYKAFQKLEIEIGFGYRFSEMAEKLSTAFALQNQQKFAEVSVIIYGLLEGVASISEKTPKALYVATLFANRADEDRTVWNQTIAEEKLADWKQINANFFLILAMRQVSGFKENIRKISQLMQSVGAISHPEQETTEEEIYLEND